MHPIRPRRGETINWERPDWQPLIEFAPEQVEDFMWMHEVELDDGTRLHAYKHYWTRRYLHLDHGGRAFAYLASERYQRPGRYEEIDPRWLLDLVLRRPPGEDNIVERNVQADFKRIKWARSTTRHRISRRRARRVIEHCGYRLREDPPPDAPLGATPRLVFLGDDDRGEALEVMAVEKKDGDLLVIDALRLRDRYRSHYEEVKRWER